MVLSMPVTPTVHQPMGYLHGGASVALAESAASLGGFLNVDSEKYNVFGIEINANHIKANVMEPFMLMRHQDILDERRWYGKLKSRTKTTG